MVEKRRRDHAVIASPFHSFRNLEHFIVRKYAILLLFLSVIANPS